MNETVTIPRGEYERLMQASEDLADLTAYDRAMARNEESIPSEFVKRMIDGESPVRVYRDLRGLTQVQLGELSGVNRVQIADIEAGSIDTVKKLAAALSVTVDDLI